MNTKLNITTLLEKKAKNLRWLEKETWISYQALWSMKNGKTKAINFDTIWKLLEAFKCKPNDLFIIIKDKLWKIIIFLF